MVNLRKGHQGFDQAVVRLGSVRLQEFQEAKLAFIK
jgi:hypothetical protein